MDNWPGVAGLGVVGAASASMTTFFGESFNPTGVGTENFESFAVGTTMPPPLAINFAGAGTATLNGSAGSIAIRNGPRTVAGRRAASGTKYVETDAGGDFNVRFNHVGGVAAFGFYGTDLGDFGNQLALRFTRNDDTTCTIAVPHSVGSGRALATGFFRPATIGPIGTDQGHSGVARGRDRADFRAGR